MSEVYTRAYEAIAHAVRRMRGEGRPAANVAAVVHAGQILAHIVAKESEQLPLPDAPQT